MFGLGPIKLILLIFAVPLYFLPSIVARSRLHPRMTLIFLANFLIGWSLVGWLAVLVWAFISDDPRQYDDPYDFE